jgi:hypothetical protein
MLFVWGLAGGDGCEAAHGALSIKVAVWCGWLRLVVCNGLVVGVLVARHVDSSASLGGLLVNASRELAEYACMPHSDKGHPAKCML